MYKQFDIIENQSKKFNNIASFQRVASREYDYDVTIAKNFNNRFVKLIRLSCCRNSDIELGKKYVRKNSVNNQKLLNNKQRAKQKIYELAFCNDWQWFFTATLNDKKIDFSRSDIDSFHKSITQWIRDYNKKYGLNIKFLLVPELHSDNINWHMHGLLNGLPVEYLKQFKIGDTMGKALAEKVKNGDIVYNWLDYSKKFGFCDLEPIKNHKAISGYMTKYITKELIESSMQLGSHLYYHSRGLQVAETIRKGHMSWQYIRPDFENEYCSIKTFDILKNINQVNGIISAIN